METPQPANSLLSTLIKTVAVFSVIYVVFNSINDEHVETIVKNINFKLAPEDDLRNPMNYYSSRELYRLMNI